MGRIVIFLSLLMFCSVLRAQTAVGIWSDHLEYDLSVDVVVTNEEVFSSTGSALLVYNKRYNELKRLSKVNGLSGTGIATIGWSASRETLIVAYNDGNIDLVNEGRIYNLPDISQKTIEGDKSINKIRCYGQYAFLACGFGIVVIDLSGYEIFDTWRPSVYGEINPVNDVAFGNGDIYAATTIGVFRAGINEDGLSFFGNWDRMEELMESDASYSSSLFSGGCLYLIKRELEGDLVYEVSSEQELFYFETGLFFNSLDPSQTGFTLTSTEKILLFDEDGEQQRTITSYGWGTPSALRSVSDGEDLWIADMQYGLVHLQGPTSFVSYILNGPIINDGAGITSSEGMIMVAGGGINSFWGNLGRESAISVYSDNSWMSASSSTHFDAMRVVVDPLDNSRLFVSTYGTGLLEYELKNGELVFVRNYRADNSPIEAITNGDTERICGISFDKNGNLWVTQPLVDSNIKMLRKDGEWVLFPNEIISPRIGDIIVTRRDHKWILLPGGNGIYVFDDNETPEYFYDDKTLFLTVRDENGAIFSNITSLVEDLDGRIWLGSDRGPLVYYNPERVFDSDLRVSRLKIARDDDSGLADYMLGMETVTSIAVDGGNRKWMGTMNSGAYLLSADGLRQIHHYNEENSPLFSNQINSLTVDDQKGYVWFVTSNGIISLRGDATEGSLGFNDVYAFPNPVREDFEGDLTITGLERETEVKVTDISGNLVYRTKSVGGQATWDLGTGSGRRVATGVYLIFCASLDGRESTVIKILVMN